jgi:hypothetical protein
MKDVYKIKAGDTIDSIKQRVIIVHEMLTNKRPADVDIADKYLQEIKKGLENLQEIVDIS